METNDKKRLLSAIFLSILFFTGWNYFYERPQAQKRANEVQSQFSTPSPTADQKGAILPAQSVSLEKALSGARVKIQTSTLQGSISLKGAVIDDVVLKNYRETADKEGAFVRLLHPMGTSSAYYTDSGWLNNGQGGGLLLPTLETTWTADHDLLTPSAPVTLSWDNGQGIRFEKKLSIDEDYVFTIQEKICNNTAQSLSLSFYSSITQNGTPKTADFFILHEGPLGFLNNQLVELKYADLQKKPLDSYMSTGGWAGVTDKYWLTALVPNQQESYQTHYKYKPVQTLDGVSDRYVVEFVGIPHDIAGNSTYETVAHVFSGAKKLNLLDTYEAKLGVKSFDLAVDFGKFYFLTKPLFHAINYLRDLLGNFGLAIMLLTVLIKAAFFPLANKSFRSMARMKKLQPKLTKLRERFGDDKVRLNQEMMNLYKDEKVNPLAGCLPILIQIPVFFALYKVLFISIEMRHAPFYGWILDLSAPDSTSLLNLFGLLPWTPPEYITILNTNIRTGIGAWPILMGITMVIQQKLSPPPADPAQAKIFMIMPVLFTIMLAQFPAGLVIYWAWNNMLTILQQWTLMKIEENKK